MEYIFQQESVCDDHPFKNVQDKKKKYLKNPNDFIF
jgi:hypothetical protein